MRHTRGFSLVELIITITILMILAVILLPIFSTFIDRANEAADLATARLLYSAAMISVSVNESWSPNTYVADADGNTPAIFQEYVGYSWPVPQKRTAISFNIEIDKSADNRPIILVYRIFLDKTEVYNQFLSCFE